MTKEERDNLLNKLTKRKNNFSLPSFVTYYLDEEHMESPTMANLLGLDESELSQNGQRILNFLESEKEILNNASFENFKWKVHAFLSLQEVLFPPYYKGMNFNTIFQIRYFYFESKYVLAECIHSGLNGMHIGNNQLLRLFIEFNLQQCYYINKGIKEHSYQGFQEYLRTSIKPGNASLVNLALPNDGFCKPIKKRIQWELNRLSGRYSHAYTNSDSPKTTGIATPHTSIESIFHYVQISSVLDSVLWMYYANFPMLFFPVDIIRRFGFNPPTGIFASPSTSAIIRKSICEEDYKLFKDYASKNEIVTNNLSWYNNLPDLTDEQIWNTSDKSREPNDSFLSLHVKQMAEFRAKSEMVVELIRRNMQEPQTVSNPEIDPDNVFEQLKFKNWQNFYKKL